MAELKPCKCGAIPTIRETSDTLQIVCGNCGKTGELILGDYYDESFMFNIYSKQAIDDWNRRIKDEQNRT